MQHPAALPGYVRPLIVLMLAFGPVPVPKAVLTCMLMRTLAIVWCLLLKQDRPVLVLVLVLVLMLMPVTACTNTRHLVAAFSFA